MQDKSQKGLFVTNWDKNLKKQTKLKGNSLCSCLKPRLYYFFKKIPLLLTQNDTPK